MGHQHSIFSNPLNLSRRIKEFSTNNLISFKEAPIYNKELFSARSAAA